MKFIRLAVVAVVLGAVGVAATLALNQPQHAPVVQYTTLDGSAHRSDALLGKVVLVNVWATSCSTCMKEMPELIATHKKYASRGLETLSVAMSYDPPAYVMNYAQTRQLPFQVTMDSSGELARQFGQVQLTPTTFVVNKKGVIVKRYIGEPDFGQLHQLIESLINES